MYMLSRLILVNTENTVSSVVQEKVRNKGKLMGDVLMIVCMMHSAATLHVPVADSRIQGFF